MLKQLVFYAYKLNKCTYIIKISENWAGNPKKKMCVCAQNGWKTLKSKDRAKKCRSLKQTGELEIDEMREKCQPKTLTGKTNQKGASYQIKKNKTPKNK